MMSFLSALKRRLRSYPRAMRVLQSISNRWRRFAGEGSPRAGEPELRALKRVLDSGQWSMLAGRGLAHEDLEREFARYVGSEHAVAVNTGGMAIQMTLRALGLRRGDEVIHQVDTCVANAFAVMNAGATPVLAEARG